MARHYARRSLRIEVTCNHCAKRLAFFNKCSLLLHAREHKEKGLIMQCSHLVMKPVPVEQMIGQLESVTLGWWTVLLMFYRTFFFFSFFNLDVIPQCGCPFVCFSLISSLQDSHHPSRARPPRTRNPRHLKQYPTQKQRQRSTSVTNVPSVRLSSAAKRRWPNIFKKSNPHKPP